MKHKPTKPPERDVRAITTRFTPEAFEAVKTAATANGMTIANTVRLAIERGLPILTKQLSK